MSESKIRVAVIGCGAQGRNHLNAYRAQSNVEIAAICDLSDERREAAAKEYGVAQHFADYRDLLLAGSYDLVSICTMPVSHCEMVTAALQAGANVICEKPMALNLAEAVQMAQAAKAADRFLTLGFNMRFLPGAQVLRKYVADGHLGKPICSRAWTVATDIPWWGKHYVKEISGGGVLASTAVHILDLALWVSGGPRPTTVSASMERVFPRKRAVTAPSAEAAASFDVEDTFSGHIRFDDGTWMTLSGGWSWDQPEYSYSFELAGDASNVQFAPLRIVAEQDGVPVELPVPEISSNPTGMSDWGPSVAAEIADVVAAVRGKRAPLVKIEEALKVQAIVDALYRSAELQREVEVELPVI
ncbi:MAG: Gfo/Idh/MocA family protein [Thermomicrobiales bacterium]